MVGVDHFINCGCRQISCETIREISRPEIQKAAHTRRLYVESIIVC